MSWQTHCSHTQWYTRLHIEYIDSCSAPVGSWVTCHTTLIMIPQEIFFLAKHCNTGKSDTAALEHYILVDLLLSQTDGSPNTVKPMIYHTAWI